MRKNEDTVYIVNPMNGFSILARFVVSQINYTVTENPNSYLPTILDKLIGSEERIGVNNFKTINFRLDPLVHLLVGLKISPNDYIDQINYLLSTNSNEKEYKIFYPKQYEENVTLNDPKHIYEVFESYIEISDYDTCSLDYIIEFAWPRFLKYCYMFGESVVINNTSHYDEATYQRFKNIPEASTYLILDKHPSSWHGEANRKIDIGNQPNENNFDFYFMRNTKNVSEYSSLLIVSKDGTFQYLNQNKQEWKISNPDTNYFSPFAKMSSDFKPFNFSLEENSNISQSMDSTADFANRLISYINEKLIGRYNTFHRQYFSTEAGLLPAAHLFCLSQVNENVWRNISKWMKWCIDYMKEFLEGNAPATVTINQVVVLAQEFTTNNIPYVIETVKEITKIFLALSHWDVLGKENYDSLDEELIKEKCIRAFSNYLSVPRYYLKSKNKQAEERKKDHVCVFLNDQNIQTVKGNIVGAQVLLGPLSDVSFVSIGREFYSLFERYYYKRNLRRIRELLKDYEFSPP